MLATRRLNELAGVLVFPARNLPERALRTDLHLHTDVTDGRSTAAEMLAAADAAGLEAVAITEHVRRGIHWFGAFRRDVRSAAASHPGLRVLVGIEAKALDLRGGLDADKQLIASADLVLGAFHNYPDDLGGFRPSSELDAREAASIEHQASWALLSHPAVDVLAHPGALTRKTFGEFPEAYMRHLVRTAARRGRAVELNAGYLDTAGLLQLLAVCRAENAWVTLGSNAHHASEVGRIGSCLQEDLARAN